MSGRGKKARDEGAHMALAKKIKGKDEVMLHVLKLVKDLQDLGDEQRQVARRGDNSISPEPLFSFQQTLNTNLSPRRPRPPGAPPSLPRRRRTLTDLALDDSYREVVDKNSDAVIDEIESTIYEIAQTVLAGEGFGYQVPSRSKANQMYIPELDRIVLKDQTSLRPFAGTQTVRKTTIMTRILQLVHELCLKRIHVTKRDLFYTDVKLFEDQVQSDAVLDDISCMLGCTRSSLHVVASEKGIVVGRLTFSEDGDPIDCRRMGIGGKAIPPHIDKVTDIQSDASFILLVEKDAAFMRLAEDRFYNQYPCIIITAKGQPDVATRLFLKKLKSTLKIPVLALVDSGKEKLVFLQLVSSRLGSIFFALASFHALLLLLVCASYRSIRLEDPVGLHEGLDEHVIRLEQPNDARHQVAGRATIGPRSIQHPTAMPPPDDRGRY